MTKLWFVAILKKNSVYCIGAWGTTIASYNHEAKTIVAINLVSEKKS